MFPSGTAAAIFPERAARSGGRRRDVRKISAECVPAPGPESGEQIKRIKKRFIRRSSSRSGEKFFSAGKIYGKLFNKVLWVYRSAECFHYRNNLTEVFVGTSTS